MKTQLVLEYFPLDLLKVLSSDEAMTEAEIKYCLQNVLAALKHCEDYKVIHRVREGSAFPFSLQNSPGLLAQTELVCVLTWCSISRPLETRENRM